MNPLPGQTYTTRYGDFTILERRDATGGILLRDKGMRHVLVGLSDFICWNPQPQPQAV